MDKTTKCVLNVLSLVLIQDDVSATSDNFRRRGTTWAMAEALALPIGYGVDHLIVKQKNLI